MRKIIFLIPLSVFLFSQSNAFAQRGGGEGHKERWEKYRTEKIAFLTTNLDLSPEEAQIFWPVYNQMDKEKSEAQKKRRELEQKVRDAEETLSDDEIIKLTRAFARNIKDEGTLFSKYNEEFLLILPPKKVLKLYQVENDFRMYMFKKYRERSRKENKHP